MLKNILDLIQNIKNQILQKVEIKIKSHEYGLLISVCFNINGNPYSYSEMLTYELIDSAFDDTILINKFCEKINIRIVSEMEKTNDKK